MKVPMPDRGERVPPTPLHHLPIIYPSFMQHIASNAMKLCTLWPATRKPHFEYLPSFTGKIHDELIGNLCRRRTSPCQLLIANCQNCPVISPIFASA